MDKECTELEEINLKLQLLSKQNNLVYIQIVPLERLQVSLLVLLLVQLHMDSNNTNNIKINNLVLVSIRKEVN